jgi:hypothetical protein
LFDMLGRPDKASPSRLTRLRKSQVKQLVPYQRAAPIVPTESNPYLEGTNGSHSPSSRGL